MAYEGLGAYATKALVCAINRINEDTAPAEILRILENTTSLVNGHVVSEAQFDVIASVMPSEVDVPEWEPETTTEGLTLQDVSDAVADLSDMVSEIIEPEEEATE